MFQEWESLGGACRIYQAIYRVLFWFSGTPSGGSNSLTSLLLGQRGEVVLEGFPPLLKQFYMIWKSARKREIPLPTSRLTVISAGVGQLAFLSFFSHLPFLSPLSLYNHFLFVCVHAYVCLQSMCVHIYVGVKGPFFFSSFIVFPLRSSVSCTVFTRDKPGGLTRFQLKHGLSPNSCQFHPPQAVFQALEEMTRGGRNHPSLPHVWKEPGCVQ